MEKGGDRQLVTLGLGAASARRAGSGGGTERKAAQGFGLAACAAIGFLCSILTLPTHARRQREAGAGESEWTGVFGC